MNNTCIEFRITYPNDENVDLTFYENDEHMTCTRLHDFCKRFAYAMGYMPENIEDIFGPTKFSC